MDKDLKLTQVTDDDIRFLEQTLSQSPKPSHLGQITEKLAFQKTASQRTQDIKIYDPSCVYEVGDAVYKEYDEPLTVSSKSVEQFKGSVILTVVHKSYYDLYQAEMLEVDYAGGGIFRRYIDYMKKTKTQVLLPSNQGGLGLKPQILDRSLDPRLSELPMTDRDFKALERSLKTVLAKSPAFFSWNDYYHLTQNRVDIPEEKIKEAEGLVAETGQSVPTETLVNKLFGLLPSSDRFELFCLSLNSILDKKHRKEFVFVFPEGWGKWHLKKLLNAMSEGLPLAPAPVKLPEAAASAPPAAGPAPAFPLKVYLTWREVLSGGIKVPRALGKELSHSQEYVFTDPEEGKNYPVYYFPKHSYFLGLSEYYAANNLPQGTSVTLEKKSPTHIHFWVKKSKKKLAVPRLAYDPKSDTFSDTGEENFTLAEPNKILFLEREFLDRLITLYPEREGRDLTELLTLIFKQFSLQSKNFSLHYLRAFHMVDLLRQTYQEDVERSLRASPDFTSSEKKKGIFFYEEPRGVEEEEEAGLEARFGEDLEAEETLEAAEESELEELPIGMTEEEYRERVPEVEVPEEPKEIISLEPKPAPPEAVAAVEARLEAEVKAVRPAKEKEAAPKKEKPAKKKKPKLEAEKMPKARKSERRVIEEKIELEESEYEALEAVKAEAPEAEEAAAQAEGIPEAAAAEKGKKEAPAAKAEGPAFGGLFAEKLKSALKKKPEEKEKEKGKEKKEKPEKKK
jgi:hypothetical protein